MPLDSRLGRLFRDVDQRYPLCTVTLLSKGFPHALAQAYRYAFLPFLQLLHAVVFHLPLLGLCSCRVCPEDALLIILSRAAPRRALPQDRRFAFVSRAKGGGMRI